MCTAYYYKFAYYALIYTLSLTLTTSLVYGLAHLPKDTISNNMLTDTVYRTVLSSTILLQLCIWCLCFYNKREMNDSAAKWGYLIMIVMLINWIGLTSILQGTAHVVFVCVFMACFLLLVLILYSMTWQDEARHFLLIALTLMLLCSFACIIIFNQSEFYLLEHISFFLYSIVFIFFFSIHPYHEWNLLPEGHCDMESAWQACYTHQQHST